MASHYKFYDGMAEIVPFQARFSYPTQGSRTWKNLIKIPPKNGSTFTALATSTPIRFELPATGYLNTRNTFLTFDVGWSTIAAASTNVRFQNNIQSTIKRLRIIYGSLVLEDIREYHVLVRLLTEGAGTQTTWNSDQCSISEGIGGIKSYPNTPSTNALTSAAMQPGNARLFEIQSANFSNLGTAANATNSQDNNQGAINSTNTTNIPRRYVVQLASGLFQQNKYLPLKWMAAQLTVEIEMATTINDCVAGTGTATSTDTYQFTNMALNCELLEFDGAYDAGFLEGLRGDGVPIKFSTWNTYVNTPANATSQTILIPERNRSLKTAFCVQLPPSRRFTSAVTVGSSIVPWDSHAFLESSTGILDNSSPPLSTGLSTGFLQSYQFRIGGKYYPSQAVLCQSSSTKTNGAAEAYAEFQKALNTVGDYRLSTGISAGRWTRPTQTATGESCACDWTGIADIADQRDLVPYVRGPSCFVVSANLETSDGSEISGLNGEEQNDIALTLNYSSQQDTRCFYLVFIYYDALLILRENNNVELIK